MKATNKQFGGSSSAKLKSNTDFYSVGKNRILKLYNYQTLIWQTPIHSFFLFNSMTTDKSA